MTTVAAKNAALDGMTITSMSLHSDFPGTTGANELSGYSRASVNITAAVGGIRTAQPATITVPAATVKWLGWWNGSTFMFATPNGGATPKNFVAIASTDLIYCPDHGYADETKIVFWGGTAPGGLTQGTTYYVRDTATDTFKVAATAGGAAIDITSASSSGCWVSQITEKTYTATGLHNLTAGTFMVPD